MLSKHDKKSLIRAV